MRMKKRVLGKLRENKLSQVELRRKSMELVGRVNARILRKYLKKMEVEKQSRTILRAKEASIVRTRVTKFLSLWVESYNTKRKPHLFLTFFPQPTEPSLESGLESRIPTSRCYPPSTT